MGVVYLADAPDGMTVAVKCLHHGVGDEVRRRLHREAQVLAAINHPRVAHYVSADVDDARPWIAMQYVAGPSLARASVPLGPAQLRHLTEGTVEALAAMHRQRLTHRDVKPGNIILTHGGPVLVDLGIAGGDDFTSLTAVGMVVGTPEWMAPEQLSGYPTGPTTDVWGWACVAVYAATGRTPFGTGAIEVLAHRIRYEEPDLRGVPDWLRGAVLAGLSKDPRARPSAAQLAAVDGIARVGAAVRTRAAPRPLVTSPPTARVPHVSPPPQPIMRPAPPQHRPPVRPETRRNRPASKPAAVASASVRPRRRRSLPRRIARTVLTTSLLLAVGLVVGVGAYAYIDHQVHGASVQDSIDQLQSWVSGLVGN